MKIWKIRITTEKKYQNAVALAIRLDRCNRDAIGKKLLNLAISKNAHMMSENRRLRRMLGRPARN
jgi:hypothetical protein